MNGTVYSKMRANESSCQAACTNAGSGCAAFAMPLGPAAEVCHLLKRPVAGDNAGHVRNREPNSGGGEGLNGSLRLDLLISVWVTKKNLGEGIATEDPNDRLRLGRQYC